MIDAIHAKKVSTGNIGDLKRQIEGNWDEEGVPLQKRESPSKFINDEFESSSNVFDTSLNQTVMDGSVIIHSGDNPLGRKSSYLSMGDSGNDDNTPPISVGNGRSSENEPNDTSMMTQLNISWVDNGINTSLVENRKEEYPEVKSKPLVERGGFAMLRQKLKEKEAKEREEKMLKNITASEARQGELFKFYF